LRNIVKNEGKIPVTKNLRDELRLILVHQQKKELKNGKN